MRAPAGSRSRPPSLRIIIGNSSPTQRTPPHQAANPVSHAKRAVFSPRACWRTTQPSLYPWVTTTILWNKMVAAWVVGGSWIARRRRRRRRKKTEKTLTKHTTEWPGWRVLYCCRL